MLRSRYILSGAVLLLETSLSAQSADRAADPYVLSAYLAREEEMELDGQLSEEVWARAEVATGFTQRDPEDGAPATETTEVRVLYSRAAVYFGIRAYDSQPNRINASIARRDNISTSDQVGILLDSYHDRRTAFRFVVTPRGGIADGVHLDDRDRFDLTWDPVWDAKTSRDQQGWTAEIRIPLSQLRYNSSNSVWGFQVFRTVQRNAETSWWAPYSKNVNGFASRFGALVGLQALPSPKRLEVRPTTVATQKFAPGSGRTFGASGGSHFDAGVDVKWGISPNVTIDFTANPDFGQVEADPAVVNLSAFETFLPERRPFFVEGRGLLPPNHVFYSRRIGRAPQRPAQAPEGGTAERPETATILGAAKLTGKIGSFGIGAVSAVTSAETAVLRDASGNVTSTPSIEPLTHYFAGRLSRDLSSGSGTLNGYVTAVNRRMSHGDFPTLRREAYSLGISGEHRWKSNEYSISWYLDTSRISGSTESIRAAQLSSIRYFQRPDAAHLAVDHSRTSLSGVKVGFETAKAAGALRYYLGAERVTPGFEQNDMGFHGRVDLQSFWGGGQFVRNQALGPFRNFRIGPDARYHRTTAGESEFIWLRPVLLNTTFRNNWTLGLNPIAVELNRWSPTALRGGPGLRSDTWHNSFMNLQTDNRRRLYLGLNGNVGGIPGQDGRFGGVGTTFFFRPTDLVNGSVGLNYYARRDPQEWVARREVSDSTHYVLGTILQRTLNLTTRLNWTLSPTLSLQIYAQPFVSAGDYSEFREVIDPNAADFDDRLRLYGSRLVCTGKLCNVDLDLDGHRDFNLRNPDFNSRQLRSTSILRWEYRPGSVLFVGWQHGRAAVLSDGSFRAGSDLVDLLSLPANDTFLIKMNYWFSL